MKRALWLLLLAGFVVAGASCHKKDKTAKPVKTEKVAKEKKVKVKKTHKKAAKHEHEQKEVAAM